VEQQHTLPVKKLSIAMALQINKDPCGMPDIHATGFMHEYKS
jgi:hypothetical protein